MYHAREGVATEVGAIDLGLVLFLPQNFTPYHIGYLDTYIEY
jgi:hypothetical protein